MADVELYRVVHCIERDPRNLEALVDAAACIANALQAGLGSCIAGTLMEQDLRDALGLKPGELVNIPKPESLA